MLKVTGLVKSFSTASAPVRAIDDVSFAVAERTCYALLGPSGCGKTTTLRCVAGLEHADAGVIEIGGQVVSDPARGIFVPVHERPIGIVFQSYAIWPHLNVFENIAYPLRVRRPRIESDEIRSRVMEVLRLVGMDDMAQRPAPQLSGGQQQRVALARAIVREPALLLLDEPLSNLDARLRDEMRDELSDMISRIGITALYVTHDQAEAFVLADTVAVMNSGKIVQEGTPRDIYARPRASFIATFLGDANLLSGRVEGSGAETLILLEGSVAHLLALTSPALPGTAVVVMIRPEDVHLSTVPPLSKTNVLSGHVEYVSFHGSQVECGVAIGGARIRAVVHPTEAPAEGGSVWLRIDPARCIVFPRTP
jgi:iron(III) transport system ATP-binding protein